MNKTNLKNKISKRIIISEIIYVVVTAIISLLMFLPIYKDRATLPGYDEEGNQIVVNLFYEKTPYQRLKAINIEWLLYLGLSLFLICIVILIISYTTNHKLDKYKKVIFIISFGLILVLLLIAAIQITMYWDYFLNI